MIRVKQRRNTPMAGGAGRGPGGGIFTCGDNRQPAQALTRGDHCHQANVGVTRPRALPSPTRSEEHTSELQSLMRISYAVFCLKKKKTKTATTPHYERVIVRNTTTNNATDHKHQSIDSTAYG